MAATQRQNEHHLTPLPAEGVAGAVPEAGSAGCSLTDRIDADASRSGCTDLPPAIDAATWATSEPPAHDPIMVDVFDRGDKVAIIAGSKQRKSFFALQLAIHVASGADFLHWHIVRPFTALIVQVEIKPEHYHRRFRRVWDALGQPDIGNRLHVMNGRGHDGLSVDAVAAVAQQLGADLVVFDPLYKLATGDENAAHDMKPVLASFDRLAQATGAAVLYIHHDPKGDASERDIRDRGAGSNVLGRDYDACVTLTAHRDNPDTAVIGTLLRNYPPRESFCATWTEGRFLYDYDPVPIKSRAGKNDAAVRAYISDHPDAGDTEIGNAIGCNRTTVYRIRKRIKGVA